jgi:DNA-binding Lrp family transcriptional regulator
MGAGNPALAIADRWQRGIPVCARPFAAMAAIDGLSEGEILAALRSLQGDGILGRVGAVVRPNAAGASTLAALSCPPRDVERVAARVSAETFVNHNYERDHRINLWFVVAAPSARQLGDALQRIRDATGYDVLDLRLARPYHIDLGFGLTPGHHKHPGGGTARRAATAGECRILASIADGLAIVPRPFAEVAARLGLSEDDIAAAIAAMLDDGIIARFGCVIRHREIGFTANAMAVWDVPDEEVDEMGLRLAGAEGVTLCYRRNRQPPDWRYNLFAMIHGRQQHDVRQRIGAMVDRLGLAAVPQDILFSTRCFTQRGARFAESVPEPAV